MTELICTIRGLEFRPKKILELRPTGSVELIKDPCGEKTGEKHTDKNAIAVYWEGKHLGFIAAQPEMQPMPTNEFLLMNWEQIESAEVLRYLYVESLFQLPVTGKNVAELLQYYESENSFFSWKDQKYWNDKNIGKLASLKIKVTLSQASIIIEEPARPKEMRCRECKNIVTHEKLSWAEAKDYKNFAQSKSKCGKCGFVSYYPFPVEQEGLQYITDKKLPF